ncbi:MAG: endopeptidase La [Bacteroidales bacterium]|nr:endopeptidase La [Bacteroidales bacterium]
MKDITSFLSSMGPDVSIIPVVQGAEAVKLDDSQLPDTLPVLALRNAVIFPGTVFPITIGRPKSIKLIEDAQKYDRFIGAVPQLDAVVEEPQAEDLFKFGTVAKVLKTIDMPDGTITAILQGYKRFELLSIIRYNPYMVGIASYPYDVETDSSDNAVKMLAKSIKEKAGSVIRMSSFAPKEAADALKGIDDFSFLVNFVATTVEVENFTERMELLQYGDIKTRGMKLLGVLDTQIQLLKIKQDINNKVKSEIDQQQREYYLNNQLKTIQEELGMDDEMEFEQLRDRAVQKNWPDEVNAIFEKEMAKLERFNPTSPDYSNQYNFIEFMLDLPWGDMSVDNLDLKHAQRVLDNDHYGLDKVKERIIEYLAVLKLKGNMKSPILCLWGPPGVGKTSLGKSIARALGRKYQRISLGGLHDESEIRGHRKTYIGALPGRILNALNKAGTSNPVIVLDEIDKVGQDFKGDPSSALLEALDPEQNNAFHDNYLDIDYDLSNVMFITTANDISTIQPALRDRMEMINVTGYLAEEKYHIAKNFLLPKQLEEHGLGKGSIRLAKDTINAIISDYTRESGVRGLEKQIAKICRMVAKKIAMEQEYDADIKPADLKEYLGLPLATFDRQKGNEAVGVVTGLAWTQVGGEILFIETSVSKGKGVLTMTGSLGDVMKESATIAYQYLKAHPEMAGLSYDEFIEKDVHVHVPEGATPKDGPSAGITLVSSMVSAFRGKKVRSALAMTGEMTLRGRVLPVGGIKEKILAAKRAGVRTIVISEENRKDVEDIPQIYVKGLEFHYVNTINDVIDFVF